MSRPTQQSVFRRLMIGMIGFGCSIGIAFPPLAWLLFDAHAFVSPAFYTMSVIAGLLTGAFNYLLFHVVVSRSIKKLAAAMADINESVHASEGDTLPERPKLPQISKDDAIGDIETAFLEMIDVVTKRIEVETTTRRMLTQIGQSMELEAVSSALLESLITICRLPVGVLYARSPRGFEQIAKIGVDLSDQIPTMVTQRESLMWRAIETGETQRIALDGQMEWLHLQIGFGTVTPSHVNLVPFIAQGQSVGLAVLACDRKVPDPSSLHLIEVLRHQVGPLLENAMLHHRMTTFAAFDELTHLFNRRFGIRRFDEEFARARRQSAPLSVIMLDVDHFKRFNDTYGHDAGDHVLESVASALVDTLRESDVVCRYGGEEFLVIAPETGLDEGAEIANRLRKAIAGLDLNWGRAKLSVHASFGVTSWPAHAASNHNELISAADAALYVSKQSGRNQVTTNKLGAYACTHRDAPTAPRALNVKAFREAG